MSAFLELDVCQQTAVSEHPRSARDRKLCAGPSTGIVFHPTANLSPHSQHLNKKVQVTAIKALYGNASLSWMILSDPSIAPALFTWFYFRSYFKDWTLSPPQDKANMCARWGITSAFFYTNAIQMVQALTSHVISANTLKPRSCAILAFMH